MASVSCKDRSEIGAHRGFTLVETLVVIAIFSIVSVAITGIFRGHSDLYRLFDAEARAGTASRMIADRMLYSIREADMVLASHDFAGIIHASGADELVLRIKTVDAAGNFIPGSFDYLAYYRDSAAPEKLFEIIDASSGSRRNSGTRQLADVTREVSLTYNTSDFAAVKTVDVKVVAAANFRQTAATSTVRIIGKLRNKN